MPFLPFRKCTIVVLAAGLIASPAAAATPSVDPLVALSLFGTAESRTTLCGSGTLACSAQSQTAAVAGSSLAVHAGASQSSSDQPQAYPPARGSMLPLWIGIAAVGAFIAWDLLTDHDRDGFSIIVPVSP